MRAFRVQVQRRVDGYVFWTEPQVVPPSQLQAIKLAEELKPGEVLDFQVEEVKA